MLQELEFIKQKENALLLINLLKLPQLEETFYFLEAQEIEKLRDISVFILVKEDLTLPHVLDAKAENGKEPEEEDDKSI